MFSLLMDLGSMDSVRMRGWRRRMLNSMSASMSTTVAWQARR